MGSNLNRNDTINYILQKYDLHLNKRRLPVEIPDTGRNDLAILFKELDFKVGVEVGVAEGFYAEILCCANPGVKLYCVDAWQKYADYRDYISSSILDGFYEEAKVRLAPYDCTLIRKFSMEAVQNFEPNSLDFVYIDGNHTLKYVVEDITEWSKRVRPGGIISGHDFRKSNTSYTAHVVQSVQAYTDAYRISPWFVLGSKGSVKGETRDEHRSWMWIKD